MRRTTIAAIALAAAVLTVGGIASAASQGTQIRNGWLGTGSAGAARLVESPATPSSDEDAFRAIFVIEHVATNEHPSGFDEFVVSGPLMNVRETRRIGSLAGDCAFADPEIAECELTANLGRPFPQGSQITIQGLSSAATHWFNAITGGTGRFDTAAGQVEARNIGTTNKIALVFRLEG
jgi:hypothetical protein